jgi:Trp operon repressor
MAPMKESLHNIASIVLRASGNKKDLENLLVDLLSPAEIEDIGDRLKIMETLVKGETQRAVSKKLSVSIAKVTRSAQVVHHGSGVLRKLLKDG